MDIDPQVEDLTRSEADDEETSGGEVASSPSGSSSSGSGSSGSSLYDNSSTTFLPVIIYDVDGDPDENSEPILVQGPPVLAMLPGPSVVTTLHWGQRGSYLAGTLWVCSEFLNNLPTLYPMGKC